MILSRFKSVTTVAFSILFMLLNSVSVFSQSNFWTELNGFAGFGGLQEGAGGKLFGNRENGVLYVSTNDGQTWAEGINFTGQVSEMVARNNTVFVARFNFSAQNFYQFHRSTDNGATWTRISTYSEITRTNFVISDAGEIYGIFRASFFGNPNGPYRLTKFDGDQWPIMNNPLPSTATSNGNTVTDVVIDHHNNIFVASELTGIYVTRDEAVTWEQIFADRGITTMTLTPENHLYIAGDPSTGAGGIHKSTDNGVTWQFLGLPENTVSSISVNPDGIPIAATDEGIYRRNPADGTWEFTSPIDEQFNATLSTSSNTIIATNYSTGIFRTSDGGQSWEQSGPRRRDVYAVLETPSGKLLAATHGGRIFSSTDGGGNWNQSSSGSVCDNVYALIEQDNIIYAGTECGLYRSADDGGTWVKVNSDGIQGSVLALAKQNDGDLFAGSAFGIEISDDNGITWRSAGAFPSVVLSIAGDYTGGLYAATDDHGVFYSNDNGLTWQSRGVVRSDVQTVSVHPDGAVFVGIYGGLLRSVNGGATWVEKRFSTGYVKSVAFLGTVAYAGASFDGAYVSYNNGDSWERLSLAGLAHQYILSLSFNANGFLFAGTYTGGVYRTTGTLTEVSDVQQIPASYSLHQNYPNPFNPGTTIEFQIPVQQSGWRESGMVRLAVFDILGREVAVLVNEQKAPGRYTVQWNAGDLPSGVYYYRLQAGPFTETRKMLLLQ